MDSMILPLIIILAIALALLLFAAEMFVFGGVLGIFGFLLLAFAIGASFYYYGAVVGFVVLFTSGLSALAIILIGFWWIRSSRAGKHLFLGDTTTKEDGFESADGSLNQYLHQSGKTASELHPTGLADFDGERISVTSDGEYIDGNVPVEVIGIRFNQVVVREITNE